MGKKNWWHERHKLKGWLNHKDIPPEIKNNIMEMKNNDSLISKIDRNRLNLDTMLTYALNPLCFSYWRRARKEYQNSREFQKNKKKILRAIERAVCYIKIAYPPIMYEFQGKVLLPELQIRKQQEWRSVIDGLRNIRKEVEETDFGRGERTGAPPDIPLKDAAKFLRVYCIFRVGKPCYPLIADFLSALLGKGFCEDDIKKMLKHKRNS